MKISKKVSNSFNRYLMMAVSFLGLFSTALLLNDPMTSDASNNPSVFNADYQKINSPNRNVASLEVVPSKVTSVISTDSLFELNCGEKGKAVQTSNRRFRLKGQTCADEAAALSTQIQNKSNGYVATVFHRDPQSFTTDYINLNEGSNEIAIKFDTLHGPIEEVLTVVRHTVLVGPVKK
jgi:hypothetical protein